MALNFPSSPGIGSVFTDTTSGFSYEWDGTVWKSYSSASTNQITILDDISASFNGSTQTFALTSSGTAISPANAQQLRIVLGGVVQAPNTNYTVSGSNITFLVAPSAGLTFSGVSQGPAVPVNTIPDGTTTSGNFNVNGKLTVGTAVTISGGIVTASSFVGNVTGTASTASFATTSFGLSGTPNLNVGIVTATEYDISGSTNTLTAGGLNVGVATATTLRVGTAITASGGIVTATSFVGNVTGNATGLSGTPNLNVGAVTASSVIVGSAVTINSSGLNLVGVITANDYDGNFILDSYLFN